MKNHAVLTMLTLFLFVLTIVLLGVSQAQDSPRPTPTRNLGYQTRIAQATDRAVKATAKATARAVVTQTPISLLVEQTMAVREITAIARKTSIPITQTARAKREEKALQKLKREEDEELLTILCARPDTTCFYRKTGGDVINPKYPIYRSGQLVIVAPEYVRQAICEIEILDGLC